MLLLESIQLFKVQYLLKEMLHLVQVPHFKVQLIQLVVLQQIAILVVVDVIEKNEELYFCK